MKMKLSGTYPDDMMLAQDLRQAEDATLEQSVLIHGQTDLKIEEQIHFHSILFHFTLQRTTR